MPVIEARGIVREYLRGHEAVRAVDDVSLAIESGEFVCITGASGAGKSTLLHLLGGLDAPTSGTVCLDDTDLASLADEDLTAFRRRKLGFVFQFFNLLPTLTAWENVALPRLLDGIPLRASRVRALELLDRVGLTARSDHRPAELSGGELQRVAICRALIADPLIVLADEPTGNLDSSTGAEVLEILRSLTADGGLTVVMVTHELSAASIGDRLVEMADGRVIADGAVPKRPARAATSR